LSETSTTAPEHPVKPLGYRAALGHVKRWIEAEILTEKERAAHVEVTIYDYFDRQASLLSKRPWCGVRVAEVDFHTKDAGGSYMQVDAPIGLAICAQVERCILALIEGWNEEEPRTGGYETDEEFDRLRIAFEHAAASETRARSGLPSGTPAKRPIRVEHNPDDAGLHRLYDDDGDLCRATVTKAADGEHTSYRERDVAAALRDAYNADTERPAACQEPATTEVAMTVTPLLAERVREIRRIFLERDHAGAEHLLRSTLEELPMDSHSESWLRAALNTMTSHEPGHGEHRHVATVVRCLDNILEAPAGANAPATV
jgi:hypothetical protein